MRKHPVVLVVDTKEVFDFMKPTLKEKLPGSKLVHIHSHDEAVAFVRSDKMADIIFLDWKMSGSSLIDAVRADLENHNTPLVIMTEATQIGPIRDYFHHHDLYFLNKPFIRIGVSKAIDRVLDSMERRRMERLHPDKEYEITVCFSEECTTTFQLVDISAEGCLLRGSTEYCQQINIYHQAQLTIDIEQYHVVLKGEVKRMCQDVPVPEDKSTMMVMIDFTDTQESHQQKLLELIDDMMFKW
ncbi:MAG: response regulator [Gammaproteobacteria bacterium]|nr:response regulator [Gammaproteobacteria bacterium]